MMMMTPEEVNEIGKKIRPFLLEIMERGLEQEDSKVHATTVIDAVGLLDDQQVGALLMTWGNLVDKLSVSGVVCMIEIQGVLDKFDTKCDNPEHDHKASSETLEDVLLSQYCKGCGHPKEDGKCERCSVEAAK